MATPKKLKEFLAGDANTRRVLEPLGYWGNKYNYTLFAMDKPMTYFISFGLLGGLIALLLPYKEYVINFSDKGITTILVNLLSSKVEEEKIAHVPAEIIGKVKVTQGPLRASFKIALENKKWTIVANKKVLFLPDQLTNLKGAIENYSK